MLFKHYLTLVVTVINSTLPPLNIKSLSHFVNKLRWLKGAVMKRCKRESTAGCFATNMRSLVLKIDIGALITACSCVYLFVAVFLSRFLSINS